MMFPRASHLAVDHISQPPSVGAAYVGQPLPSSTNLNRGAIDLTEDTTVPAMLEAGGQGQPGLNVQVRAASHKVKNYCRAWNRMSGRLSTIDDDAVVSYPAYTTAKVLVLRK